MLDKVTGLLVRGNVTQVSKLLKAVVWEGLSDYTPLLLGMPIFDVRFLKWELQFRTEGLTICVQRRSEEEYQIIVIATFTLQDFGDVNPKEVLNLTTQMKEFPHIELEADVKMSMDDLITYLKKKVEHGELCS